ncbi:hypothetical protein [Caballeronia sp. AZ7_KS35]|uniref:hypothetical protein n=1 Tax=Caballeronia sp. AZ7_KS35 TaxID=2921762 RepID=UPI002027DE80|nr:hypothetical protein [Caballeronia sp. AZ7_KS35]
MAKIMLGFPNQTDVATLSGGSWQVPLTNLQDARLSRVARSTTALKVDAQFDVDLGIPRKLSMFAMVRHNMSLNGRYRVRVSRTPDFATTLFDSNVSDPISGSVWRQAWPRLYSPSMLDWEDPNWWDGRLPEDQRKSYPALILCISKTPVFGRYIRFEFDDEANLDGYLEFGRVFVSQAWTPKINASYGASLGWEFDTTMDRAVDGTPYFDRKTGRRVQKFSFDALSDDEAYGRIFEMQRAAGVDQELMFAFDHDDPINLLRHSFLARMRQINPLQLSFLNNHTNAYELEEIR